MNDWLAALARALDSEPALIRVVVASVKGSAPREAGACMLVGAAGLHGSIGGGNLEMKAIGIAREMLAQRAGVAPRLDRFALGATLGQCCGGAVNLWFERFDSADAGFVSEALAARSRGAAVIATELHRDGAARRAIVTRGRPLPRSGFAAHRAASSAADNLLAESAATPRAVLVPGGDGDRPILLERADPARVPLWLFGAGHVGRAVASVFADLPFDITWIDGRANEFPETVPANVTVLHSAAPAGEVARAPRGACFLVMTHSHDLDYEICRAILDRDDHAWAGLIGSETKAACFAVRYAREGVPAEAVARLTCPVGTREIRSKLPGAIAVSIAAQLLQLLQSAGELTAAGPGHELADAGEITRPPGAQSARG
ncbi:MAG: xanthine dehydrogenase accessory protein XdhC [Betaproteobacteria bacterium]|nr:xanthine dehydrogenase accessory protein XdhC [Betaproteobacteria bacterium]